MELQQLVEGRNQKLYEVVSQHFHVELRAQQDWRENAWSSHIEGDSLIINYGTTPFPKAAFAHELLYADTQIKGFKTVYTGISLDKKVQPFLPTLIKYLNNHFQHHKMAEAFLALGYPAEHFYGMEEEDSTASFLLQELNNAGHSQLYLSLLYLDFIAPLADITAEEKHSLQKLFDEYDRGQFKQTFTQIDKVINDWTKAASYNAEAYQIDFLWSIGIDNTWMSYQKDFPGMLEQHFPASGFFIGNSFEVRDVE